MFTRTIVPVTLRLITIDKANAYLRTSISVSSTTQMIRMQGSLVSILEYIVSEKLFNSLPQDEKKYWHSHKHEIESGLLQMQAKGLVPGAATDLAEQPAMLELHSTYGKTIHTWAIDIHPEIPLGPPNLMMSYTQDDQIDPALVKARDDKWGMSTEAKRQLRKGYLPQYEKASDSDMWEKQGKGIVFEPVEKDIKK